MAYYQTQSAQPPVHFPQYPPFSHPPELYAPHHAQQQQQQRYQQHRMQQPPPPQGYPNSYEHSQPDPQHYYPPPSGQRPVYPSDVSIPQGSQSGYKMSNYGGQTGGYGQQNGSQRLDPPRLSSNYIPGGQDDYYQMPELISPSPQRIMPEVPSNMQDSLAALELEARNPQRVASQSTVSSQYSASQARGGTPAEQRPAGPQYTASYDHTNASAYQNMEADSLQPAPLHNHPPESPNFSPFPRPRNAGPNVPMTNDDKEDSLERARPGVLKCNNPEVQLAWAQDALGWVEIASQNSARIAEGTGSTRSVTPRIEHQLRVDALSIVNFLAEQQHPKAEFIKAMWLEFGKFGYRVDKKEAFLGYRRAAERGYARAEYRIGMQYESTNDSAKAIKHYNIGVKLKDSASNYRLGMMVLLGQHNQPQNYQHGLELIRFAADTADENAPQGAYVYGMLLARELPNINIPDPFLPLDMNEAKLFIEKAAYLGFAKAQLKMAQAYELCQLGCDFDPALSLHYNALAARQGEPEADMAISKWFLCGYEGIFEKNEELAFTYAKRAAQTKMATAEFAMGYFYEIGMYVTKDIQEAAMWYQKAADHGNKDALGRIDSISHNKTLSKSDHEQVALSRIKSQYGSMRGKRPDRLKQRGAAMPSMSEENINMPPDHRDSYVRPQSNPPPAVRPVSVAPYPEDDVANGRGGPQPPRSPYYRPDVRASSGLGPPVADRPSSAFGIRPPAHSNTAPYPAGSLHPHADPVRPATSQGNAPMSGGTNIAPPNRAPSPYWEPQKPAGYRDPSPARVPVQSQQAGRMQKQPPANYNKPQPPMPFQPQPGADVGRKPVASSGYPGQVPAQINTPPYDGRTSVASSNQQRPTPPMTPQHQQLQSPPPRFDSAQSMRQEPSRASQRPAQQTMSSQDPKASTATASSASSTSSKVKPGPSTFEEMGIPAGKTEGDCIVM